MLNREIVQAMNDAPVQDRICLVTDDVPLPRLMRQGHLNFVVERALELGLDPIRAIRYATITTAVRLRLYHTCLLYTSPQVAPKFLAWRDGPHEAPAQPAEAPKAPPADPNAVRELFVEYKF